MRTVAQLRQTDQADELFPVENRQLTVGILALGVKPVKVCAEGSKMIVYFLKKEAYEVTLLINAGLIASDDGVDVLKVDYRRIITADSWWIGMLAMSKGSY